MLVVIGGSFDPIHFGHIRPALELLALKEVSEVRFIPCASNPDKKQTMASSQQRLDMLRLIKHDALCIDDREIVKGGTSYTIDTIRCLRDELGEDAPLAFAVGMDVFNQIAQWENADGLADLMHLIVLQRPGNVYHASTMWSQVQDIKELLKVPSGRYICMDNQLIDISATLIRELLAQKKQPKYMMPGVVWNYIRRNQLYGWKEE